MKEREITAVFERKWCRMGGAEYVLKSLTNAVKLLNANDVDIYVGAFVTAKDIEAIIKGYPTATIKVSAV